MSTKAKKAAPKKEETGKAAGKKGAAAAAPTKAGKAAKGAPAIEAKSAAEGAEGEPAVDPEEAEEAAAEAASSGGGGNAAALAAASGSGEMSASFKNFRHHPDMENFYRFIYDNDLRHEALAIIDQIQTEKHERKMSKQGAGKH
jgi:hypothetical protein